MKTALIYDPYLDTMGGGERYCITFASVLKSLGYSVVFAWSDSQILSQAANRFGLESDFSCDPIAHEVFIRGSLFSKYNLTRKCELVFFISDGSIPFLFGKKNIVHFQVPFTKLGTDTIVNQLKSFFINKLVFNSKFTSSVIMRQLPLYHSTVIYPPIDTESFKAGEKENIILSVARFDSPSHAKRQDILIETFKKLNKRVGNYKLILAGGLINDESYLSSLKSIAGELPVDFLPNPTFSQLKNLYSRARIFWHAAGYNIDEVKEPQKVEHFGMTTVEAMSAGAVPVVINRGGQREIITNGTGFLCETTEEVVSRTVELINLPGKCSEMSAKTVTRAQDFSLERFTSQIKILLQKSNV